jgi:hypothetical protein
MFNNTSYLTRNAKGEVGLVMGNGTPAALSNIFRDNATLVKLAMAGAKSGKAALAAVMALAPTYQSGPRVNELTVDFRLLSSDDEDVALRDAAPNLLETGKAAQTGCDLQMSLAHDRLIAAAPDLLAALKEMIGCPDAAVAMARAGHYEAARAAIAKAEGGDA